MATASAMQATVYDHPLIAEAIGILRNRDTSVAVFRQTIERLGEYLAYELCRDAATVDQIVQTPIAPATAQRITTVPLLAPVLRAGLALVPGFTRIFPAAAVSHIGLYRDPQTLNAVPYYANIPDRIGDRPVYVLDPMLATGNSACAAIANFADRGADEIILVSVIAAPAGIACVKAAYPNVRIVSAAIDNELNDHGYIVPGLGDAGDRIFGSDRSVPVEVTITTR